jgi:hypothetical protein
VDADARTDMAWRRRGAILTGICVLTLRFQLAL